MRALPGEDAMRRQRVFSFDRPSRRKIPEHTTGRRPILGAASAETAIVRVVLIRVSFETDRDDALSSLRRDGNFDLTPGGGSVIDPTPHDRGYFNSHMIGLNNFVKFQSCGRLELEWTVLPEENAASYKLTDLAYYGPGQGGDWTIEKLVEFFRDCVLAADEGEGYAFPWNEYDAIIVAHAGANLQSDIDYDTPNDVPSFFARLGDGDYFTVSSGDTIYDGSVIPETAVQDGFYGGIAAVMAHEFCHQLGLPDLYNIYYNEPAVGVWDLMDSGGLLGAYMEDDEGGLHYVEGFIPSGLSAWSRTLLGWTSVDTVDGFDYDIALPAVEKQPARVVRVEMASDEYLLIENRAVELDDIPTNYVFDDNGVIIGVGNCLDCDGSGSGGSEWELVNGYDCLLPIEPDSLDDQVIAYDDGPGLLIWHIDERLIAERWEENVINSQAPFGVSLFEAGGVVDLGDPSAYFPWGWYDDAYYEGNNSTLSDETLPPSWSNWNVPTGVRVENVSTRDTLMTFNAGVPDRLSTRLAAAPGRPAPGGVLPLSGEFRTLMLDPDGRAWLAGTESFLFSLYQPIVTPPALAAGFEPGIDAVVIGEERGVIHLIRDSDWSEPDGWPYEGIVGRLSTHPVVLKPQGDFLVVAADDEGFFYLIDHEGNDYPGFSPHQLPDYDRVLGNIVIAVDTLYRAAGIFFIDGGVEPKPHAWILGWDLSGFGWGGSPVMFPGYPMYFELEEDEVLGEISVLGGEIDPLSDGYELYIALHASGRLLLCGGGGVHAIRDREDRIATIPALYDLNGDSFLDCIYSDGEYIHAVNPSGANLTGWPRRPEELYQLPWEVDISAPIMVAHTASGGVVLAGTRRGILYRLDHLGELADGYPWKLSRGFEAAVEVVVSGAGCMLAFLDDGYYRWRRGGLELPDQSGLALDFRSWHSTWGDRSRSAFALPAGTADGKAGGWMQLARDLVVYPNPSRGSRIGFHFTAPETGEAYLEVMTISGEPVLDRSKNCAGGQDEFIVSMQDEASGIYLCRLKVRSGGREIEAYRKFAIVK